MTHFLKILVGNFLFSSSCLFAIVNMSLEDKVGQLFICCFQGETAGEEARILIQDVKVGGVIYYNFSNGLHSSQQVRELSYSLQELVKKNQNPIPLFISIDQEGGRVARLKAGFTSFPSNSDCACGNNSDLAKDIALAIGKELKSVGINMNFAPVVDVNSNLKNPVIGTRAFSNDPKVVSAFGAKALEGYAKAGVIAVLKHFPGHGDVEIDSHQDLPIVNKSLAELEKVELLPFINLGRFADVIMTAHLSVPAFDEKNCITLSGKTISYLRDVIGFNGVIITDSLVMEGVLKKCTSVEDAAIRALNAGCDLLLFGGAKLIGKDMAISAAEIKRIHKQVVVAVETGVISEDRLNQAVERVLSLKKRYLDIYSFRISQADACKIGDKIWKNECGGTIKGLTNWNSGENFPSLGIGHFIWYPQEEKGKFKETFLDLLQFLQKQDVILPEWLSGCPRCPWSSREEFYKNINSANMNSLRDLLFDTRDLQAIFIAGRLEELIPDLITSCHEDEKMKIISIFKQLSGSATGLYALIDYLNFKGAGTLPNETYNGQGWGLLQVLQQMPVASSSLNTDFVKSAKEILIKRVENSPPERKEDKWLKGWLNRLDTYLIE